MNKVNKKASFPTLARGQLWRLNHAYIQIVDLGKRLLQYRMMTRPGETWVKAQLSGVETMWGYLRTRRAKLVKSESANGA